MITFVAKRRRQAVLALVPAGMASIALLWWFEASRGLLAPFDLYGYPALLTALAASFGLLMLPRPAWQRFGEYAAFGTVAVYMVVALQAFVLSPHAHALYAVANTLQWMPVLYVGAFAFFPPTVAVTASVALLVFSGLTPAWAVLRGTSHWSADIGTLLINAYGAHLLVLLCLSMIVALRRQIAVVSAHAAEMESAAFTDGLTGTQNRRGMERLLREYAHNLPRPSSLLLFDLDHFKLVNDRFGHMVGDEVLISTAQLIRSQLRVGDTIYRWGGEEFLVVALGMDGAGAEDLAERVRRVVAASVHPVAGSLSVSAGVSVCSAGEDLAAALARADQALYHAKDSGRNRVSVA